MRTLTAAAPLVAALALTATACGGSTHSAAGAPTQAARTTASPDPDADACKVLAAMTFDVSTQDKSTTTQDQINAALNLLPQHDAPLGSDILAAENALVTLDTDFVAVQFGNAGSQAQYQADASKLDSALLTVAADCQGHGEPFTAHLITAS